MINLGALNCCSWLPSLGTCANLESLDVYLRRQRTHFRLLELYTIRKPGGGASSIPATVGARWFSRCHAYGSVVLSISRGDKRHAARPETGLKAPLQSGSSCERACRCSVRTTVLTYAFETLCGEKPKPKRTGSFASASTRRVSRWSRWSFCGWVVACLAWVEVGRKLPRPPRLL